MGQAHLALDLALETTCPSYGYQIAQGATTLWENWSGTDVDDANPMTGQGPSHNHHFMGGIGQWLQSDLVGLQQGSGTAFSHPVIAPRIVNHTDLPSAAGRWETPRGLLSVAWSLDQTTHSLSLNVSTPPNTAATVVFPCQSKSIVEGGVPVWSDGVFKAGAVKGIDAGAMQHGGLEDGLVAFSCGSGDYVFEASCEY
jgi:alpha-L-rhamnosidase